MGDRFRERAESRGQIDYFRRAAEQLAATSTVRVVVIVGTDVYDKLILLRALRPVLSNCVFLTTDLDARLLHRDEAAFTRNLLVASHYGLALGGTSPLPPFRDTYQTAVFDATLRILDVNESGPLLAAADAWSLHPEELRRWFRDRTRGTYEIGRRSAHALTPLGRAPAVASADDRPVLDALRLVPINAIWASLCLASALAATLGAAWLAWRSRQQQTTGRWILVRALPLLGAGVAVGPWWLAALVGPGAEPDARFDGVNVQFSMLLQVFAAMLAIWFLVGGRGVYSELDTAAGPWRLMGWGVIPFALVGAVGVLAGAWSGLGMTVGATDLWIVRSADLRWAVIIAHTLAMGAVAALGGIAFACCRRAVRRIDRVREQGAATPLQAQQALQEAEMLCAGADRMAIQVSQVVMVLLISMLPIFERWPVRPLDLALPIGAGLLALITAGRVTAAESALRSSLLQRLREQLVRTPEDGDLKLAVQVVSDRGAARQPIHRRLLLTTLAIPLGGLSLIQLLPALLGR